jgi:medium-chain acyl-[acyl-carrier-protein] hydrolase
MGGTPEVILREREMLELLMPALRADFEILETYRFNAGAPLDCPITVYHGIRDRLVDDADVSGWEVYSRRSFRLERIEAGHFFLHEPFFLDPFCSELREIGGTCPASADGAPAAGRGES